MERIDEAFVQVLRQMAAGGDPPAEATEGAARPRVDPAVLADLFTSQLISRHADLAAREMRSTGRSYYTIGSSGHEGNAAVAAALRPTDPALLHYRSGAFYAHRARQVDGIDPLRDILLGVAAAAEEPIAGGRHKVFGRGELAVIPQTSTIASHLPRALGVAFALSRAAKLGVTPLFPTDSVVVCSFGDASINHSTAVGAINAAIQVGYRGMPMPLLLVCEDNGLGISVRTPRDWVASSFGGRPGLEYRHADGTDAAETLAVAGELADWVRRRRRPALLHLSTIRLMGHAGSDVESGYRPRAEIAAEMGRDPLLRTATQLIRAGYRTPQQILQQYEDMRERAVAVAAEAAALPELRTAEQVMAPLQRTEPDAVRRTASRAAAPDRRAAMHGRKLPEQQGGLTVAQAINRALRDLLAADPGVLIFGEDVAVKGGVYGVTRGLAAAAGPARVFDTLLDEQTILGIALGAGVSGLLPIPEIQYLAYLHNAADQIRGEGATQAFFSSGAFTNPMVVRIAGYAYQKGFGGHFHNDNSVAALRDIPGLVIASPARPGDAAAMLRTCAAVARAEGRVCVFVEPIALYHTADLHDDGDDGWLQPYPAPPDWDAGHVPVGRARVYLPGDAAIGSGPGVGDPELTIVSWANGLRMSLRIAKSLAAQGVSAQVVDLRWLAPLPVDDVLAAAESTGTVLIVDETRSTGGVSESLITALAERGFSGRVARVAARDSFVPLGNAANLVLVSEDEIERAALGLLGR